MPIQHGTMSQSGLLASYRASLLHYVGSSTFPTDRTIEIAVPELTSQTIIPAVLKMELEKLAFIPEASTKIRKSINIGVIDKSMNHMSCLQMVRALEQTTNQYADVARPTVESTPQPEQMKHNTLNQHPGVVRLAAINTPALKQIKIRTTATKTETARPRTTTPKYKKTQTRQVR